MYRGLGKLSFIREAARSQIHRPFGAPTRIASDHPVPKPALSTWNLCMLDRLSLFHQARIASGPNHAVGDLKATLLRAARGFLSGP